MVGLAIFGHCFAILVDEPEEEVDKYYVGFMEALLLEGRVHLV